MKHKFWHLGNKNRPRAHAGSAKIKVIKVGKHHGRRHDRFTAPRRPPCYPWPHENHAGPQAACEPRSASERLREGEAPVCPAPAMQPASRQQQSVLRRPSSATAGSGAGTRGGGGTAVLNAHQHNLRTRPSSAFAWASSAGSGSRSHHLARGGSRGGVSVRAVPAVPCQHRSAYCRPLARFAQFAHDIG